MEHCPNCRSETRHGARFCTSCGYRFVDDSESGAWAPVAVISDESESLDVSQMPPQESANLDGWPSPPAADAASAGGDGLASPLDATNPEPSSMPETDYAGFWPESPPADWRSPITLTASADSDIEPTSDSAIAAPTERETEARAAPPGSQQQVLDLVDQLRAAIVTMSAAESPDLSGVVSDLEVAATPPGALPQDQLAELREALFAAKENPRDVDTIVDLTRRIDGLVSLVIAYDRAMAAIERSLTALKREGDGVSG
jgi:hypothetical protein